MKRCRDKMKPEERMTTVGLLAAKAVFEKLVAQGETCFAPGIVRIDEELAKRPGPKPKIKARVM